MQDEVRRLDQWPVAVVAVENLDWVPHGRDGVLGDFLQHDGRWLERWDAVVAVPAVSNAVAVDLVDDIVSPVLVKEA